MSHFSSARADGRLALEKALLVPERLTATRRTMGTRDELMSLMTLVRLCESPDMSDVSFALFLPASLPTDL